MGVFLYFFFFWPHCLACGIIVPDQGSNLGPQEAVRAQSSNHWTTWEFPDMVLYKDVQRKHTDLNRGII